MPSNFQQIVDFVKQASAGMQVFVASDAALFLRSNDNYYAGRAIRFIATIGWDQKLLHTRLKQHVTIHNEISADDKRYYINIGDFDLYFDIDQSFDPIHHVADFNYEQIFYDLTRNTWVGDAQSLSEIGESRLLRSNRPAEKWLEDDFVFKFLLQVGRLSVKDSVDPTNLEILQQISLQQTEQSVRVDTINFAIDLIKTRRPGYAMKLICQMPDGQSWLFFLLIECLMDRNILISEDASPEISLTDKKLDLVDAYALFLSSKGSIDSLRVSTVLKTLFDAPSLDIQLPTISITEVVRAQSVVSLFTDYNITLISPENPIWTGASTPVTVVVNIDDANAVGSVGWSNPLTYPSNGTMTLVTCPGGEGGVCYQGDVPLQRNVINVITITNIPPQGSPYSTKSVELRVSQGSAPWVKIRLDAMALSTHNPNLHRTGTKEAVNCALSNVYASVYHQNLHPNQNIESWLVVYVYDTDDITPLTIFFHNPAYPTDFPLMRPYNPNLPCGRHRVKISYRWGGETHCYDEIWISAVDSSCAPPYDQNPVCLGSSGPSGPSGPGGTGSSGGSGPSGESGPSGPTEPPPPPPYWYYSCIPSKCLQEGHKGCCCCDAVNYSTPLKIRCHDRILVSCNEFGDGPLGGHPWQDARPGPVTGEGFPHCKCDPFPENCDICHQRCYDILHGTACTDNSLAEWFHTTGPCRCECKINEHGVCKLTCATCHGEICDSDITVEGSNCAYKMWLTPNQNCCASPFIVDFMFCVDFSGSMDDKIDEIVNKIGQLVDRLATHGAGLRIGYWSFGSPLTEIIYQQPFTTDIEQFKQKLNSQGTAGGYEYDILCMREAAEQSEWLYSTRYMLLVGDEDSQDPNPLPDVNATIQACLDKKIKVICVGITPERQSVVTATGGAIFSIIDDFTQVIDQIEFLDVPTSCDCLDMTPLPVWRCLNEDCSQKTDLTEIVKCVKDDLSDCDCTKPNTYQICGHTIVVTPQDPVLRCCDEIGDGTWGCECPEIPEEECCGPKCEGIDVCPPNFYSPQDAIDRLWEDCCEKYGGQGGCYDPDNCSEVGDCPDCCHPDLNDPRCVDCFVVLPDGQGGSYEYHYSQLVQEVMEEWEKCQGPSGPPSWQPDMCKSNCRKMDECITNYASFGEICNDTTMFASCSLIKHPSSVVLNNGIGLVAYEQAEEGGITSIKVRQFTTSMPGKVLPNREFNFARLQHRSRWADVTGGYIAKLYYYNDEAPISFITGGAEGNWKDILAFRTGPLAHMCFNLIDPPTGADDIGKFIQFFIPEAILATFPSSDDVYNIKWFIIDKEDTGAIGTAKDEGGGSIGRNKVDTEMQLPPHVYGGIAAPVAYPSLATCYNYANMLENSHFVYLAYQALEDGKWNVYLRQLRLSEFLSENSAGTTKMPISNLGVSQVVYRVVCVNDNCEALGDDQLIARSVTLQAFLPDGREVYNDGYDSSTNWEHACEGLPASDFPKHKVYIKLLHSIIGNGCPDYNTGFDAMFVNWRVGDEFTVPPIAMSAPSLFAALQKGDATVSLGDFSTPVVINGISIKSSHVQVTWYDSPSVATWSTVVDPSYSDIQRIKGIDIGEPILLTGDKQTHSTRPVVKANYNNEVFVVYQNGDSGEFQVYLTGTAVPASELPMGITNPRTFDESLNYFYSTSDFVYSTQITSERSNSMPDMYIDLGNTIHLTWQSNRDGNWEVYYADSTHGFSNTRITEHNSKSVMPRLHGDGNGRVYITWSDDRFGAWDIMLAYILDTRVESLLEQDPYLAGTYNGYTHSYDQADLPLMNVSSSTVCITELEVHFYADRYRQLPIFTMTQSDYPYAFTVQSAGDELSTKTWETFELWTSNGTELTSDVVDTGLFQSELLRFNVNFSLPSLSSPIQVQEGLWVEEITGSIPAGSKIAAITNAAYSKAGEQSMQHEFFYAYVYSNILYVKRYSFGSVDTWSKDLSLTLYEVTDLKFDTTNVFNNYLHIAVKVDDAGDTQTVICTLSPAGVITDVVTMGSDIDAIIAFNEGANGYAAGLYLEDRLRSYGTNLLILDSAYELFDYAWDFVPPGRQDMDVAAIDFDPTGQYYNRLVMADYDLDADDVSAIYYLKPKAGEDWQSTDFETIFFQTPAVRRYVAMGFSNSALFGSSLYVADAAANAIYAVNTSGDHAPFATGFTSLSAMSFAYDSSILYVIDNGTVYRISATPMLQIGFLAGDQYSGGQITDGTWVSAYSIPFSQSGRDITPYDVGIPGRIAGQYKQVRLFWSSWTDLSWLHSVSITSGIAGRLCIPPESSAIATLSLLPTVRIDDAGNVEETELPADLIPNRAYFVSMFGRDPTNQLISLGDPQITISASTTERHETDLGRYTCSIPITVTNTTYTAKYYNFKVNFYSDKEKLYLLQSYNTFPSGRLDRFTIDDGQPATTRWTAKGLRVAPNATLTLALWPVVSNAGLTCDVEYFVDIESCNSDEGTTIPACQSRDLIVWQSLRWVCRCESARASAAFGTRPRYLPDLARWQSSAFGMADTRITEIIGTENIQPNIRIRSNWEGVILYSSNRAVPSSPFYELYASVFKTIPGHGMYANAAQNIVSPEGTVFVKKDIPVCADKGCVDENGKYVDGQILRGTYPSLDIDQFDHMFLSTEQRYDSLDQHLDVTLCEFLEKDKSQVVRIHRCGANPEYLVWGETQESGATGPSGPAGCQPSELINTFSTVSEELKKLVLSARIKNQFVKYHVTRHRIPMAVVGRSKVIIEVLGQPGAIGVRLRNNNKEEWSDWFPFEPKTDDYITEIPWILGPGNGYNNVYLQVISVQGTSQIFVLQFIADYDKVQYSINLYQLPAAGATGPAGPTGPRMLPSYNGLPLASMGAPLFDGSNLTYPAMQQFRVEIVPSVDYMRMFSTDEKNSGEANPTFDFLHQGDLDYLEQPTEYRTTLATGESQECFWGTITVKKEEKPEFKDGLATIIPKFKRDYSETPSTTTGGLAGAGAGNLGPPSDTYVRDEWNVFGSPITDTSCEGATWPDGGTVITDQEVWEDVFGQIRHRIVIRPTEDPFLIFGDPNYRFGGENDPV